MTGTVPPNDQHGQHNQPVNPAAQWHPQGATYLNPIAPPIAPHLQRKPWPSWVIALIGLVSVGLLGVFAFTAAALKDEPKATPTSGIGTPAPYDALPGQPAPTSTAGNPGDSAGRRACEKIRTALDSGTTDPATLAGATVDGKYSSNNSIRIASELLADYARLAVAARGAADEKGLVDDVVRSARALEQACTTYGYYRT